MRLYFFPGLLPLAPLVPWLLTAIGALAGAARAIGKRRGLGLLALGCFLAAALFALHQSRQAPSAADGTRLTPRESLPRLTAEKDSGVTQITGASDVSSPMTQAVLRERWFQLTPRRGMSTPAVAGDLLLLGTGEGTLDAFSRATGRLAWSLRKKEPILAAPVLVSARIALAGEGLHSAVTSALTAVSLPEGKPLWQREFIGHLEDAPALDASRGILWQGSGPRGLWAIDARDGSVLWHAQLGHVDARPLLAGDRLVVSAQPEESRKESALFLLDPKTGKSLASLTLPGQPWGAPRTGDGGRSVVLTTGIGQIGPRKNTDRGWAHRVSLAGPRLEWTVELPGMPLYESPVLASKGLVFHALKQGTLLAQRLRDGSIAWSAELGSDIHAPPTLITAFRKPLLAVVATGGILSLRDALTGAEIDRLEVGHDATSAPVFADGMLYVVTPGTLAAYGLDLR